MKSSWQRKPSKTLTGSQVLDERRRLKATVNIQGQMLTLAQLKLVLASCDSLPGLGFETGKDRLSHNIGRRGGRTLLQIQRFSTGHRSSRCAMESSRPVYAAKEHKPLVCSRHFGMLLHQGSRSGKLPKSPFPGDSYGPPPGAYGLAATKRTRPSRRRARSRLQNPR
jgi:hypothetical protein